MSEVDASTPLPPLSPLEYSLESLSQQRSQIELEGEGGQQSVRLLPGVTHVLVPRWVASLRPEEVEPAVALYDEW